MEFVRVTICPQKLPEILIYNRDDQRSATNQLSQNTKFWQWD